MDEKLGKGSKESKTDSQLSMSKGDRIRRDSALPDLRYRSRTFNWRQVGVFFLIALFVGFGLTYWFMPGRVLGWKSSFIIYVKQMWNDHYTMESSGTLEGVASRDASYCGDVLVGGEGKDRSQLEGLELLSKFRSCFIVRYQYDEVLSHLWHFYPPLSAENKGKLKKVKRWSKGQAIEYLDMIVALSSVWRQGEAYREGRRQCPRWEVSIGCVGRLLAIAMTFRVEQLPKGLIQQMLEAPGIRQYSGIIHYSSAMILVRQKRFVLAESELNVAYKNSDRQVSWRRLILDGLCEVAYLSGSRELQQSVNLLFLEDKVLDERAQTVKVMFDSLNSAVAVSKMELKIASLNRFIGRNSQMRYIDYVFREKIQEVNLDSSPEEFDQFYREIRDQYNLSKSSRRPLELWRIRWLMALGDYKNALSYLTVYMNLYPNDWVGRHLRGSILLSQSRAAKEFLRAGIEFQIANKEHESWQSTYALGVCLIGGKMGKKLGVVLDRLKQLARQQPRSSDLIILWSNLLNVEWTMKKGLAEQGLAYLGRIQQIHPELSRIDDLRLNALNLSGQHSEYQVLRRQRVNLPRYSSIQFRRYGDPLGPRAFLLEK